MTETSREKCRVVVSRRIQKRCARFKPCNSRRKRTRQVPKASGPSILEDRWQRSGSFCEFKVREFGGQTQFLVFHEVPSCEEEGRRSKPLDPSHRRTVGSEPLHVVSCIGGSRVERVPFRLQKLQSVER
jgi:hypothetical protein